MLNEATIIHHLQEVLFGGVVVVDAIFLAFSWPSCGVRYGEPEAIGVGLEQTLEKGGLAGA